MAEKRKQMLDELKIFLKELKSYKRRLGPDKQASEAQQRYTDSLRERLLRKTGSLKDTIVRLTGKQYYTQFGVRGDFWVEGLSSSGYLPSMLVSLGYCIDTTNEAIGKLESRPLTELGTQEAEHMTAESPIKIFDAMCLHPRVVEVSESLFKTGNYSSAIFEAFKAVHNYVQDKTGLTLGGVNLMEKVFNENKPILQLNELLTKSDRDEQKGFKYLFMGSQMGIRNPPAHENVRPEEQNIALEYLGIASLLMRRIDGSKLVKLNI